MRNLALGISEVDGVVKTIFISFLDAVPGEERVAEGERKEPVGRLEFPLRGLTIATQSVYPLDCQEMCLTCPSNSLHGIHNVPREGSCMPMPDGSVGRCKRENIHPVRSAHPSEPGILLCRPPHI